MQLLLWIVEAHCIRAFLFIVGVGPFVLLSCSAVARIEPYRRFPSLGYSLFLSCCSVLFHLSELGAFFDDAVSGTLSFLFLSILIVFVLFLCLSMVFICLYMFFRALFCKTSTGCLHVFSKC